MSYMMAVALSVAAFANVDLVIGSADLAVTPSNPTTADALVFTVTVHNVGSEASPAGSLLGKVLRGNKKSYKQTAALPSIPPGGSAEVAFTVGPLEARSYTLSAKADPQNKIRESSESNNKATAPMTVSVAGSDAGEAAAAVYLTSQETAQTFLDVADLALVGLRGSAEASAQPSDLGSLAQMTHALSLALGNPEAAWNCSKGGAFDYTVVVGSTVRPTSMSITSPGAGSTDCESWVYRDPQDLSVGLYERFRGSLLLEIRYVSDSPLDPGYLKVASMTLTAGDGNPSTQDAFALSTWESYRDGSGALLERLLATESCDFVMTLTVVGWDALGFPNHILYGATGTLSHYDSLSGSTLVASCSGFTLDATYVGTTSDLTILSAFGGGIAVTHSGNPAGDFAVTFRTFGMSLHATPGAVELSAGGYFDLVSSCATGGFDVATAEPVVFLPGAVCPRSGRVGVNSQTLGAAIVVFNADGSVSVDEGADGSVDRSYESCAMLAFEMCGW